MKTTCDRMGDELGNLNSPIITPKLTISLPYLNIVANLHMHVRYSTIKHQSKRQMGKKKKSLSQ